MIYSMTGFGRGCALSPAKKITVELKSLNSKQFDITMRVPACFRDLEVETRNRLASLLERGKVDLVVTFENLGAEAPATVNNAVVVKYKEQLSALAQELGVSEPADWIPVLLRMPDALKMETTAIDDADIVAFNEALDQAVTGLKEFRAMEGRKLYDFFKIKIDNIRTFLAEIEPYEAERVGKIKVRLEDQLSRLNSIEYDRGRLEQEMIFYIEKLDVNEEKLRLRSHLDYFLETMGSEEQKDGEQGVGKKLGFIAQEMGREINTLGSKSNQAEMQKGVVKMKDELEQIKEQVLNAL